LLQNHLHDHWQRNLHACSDGTFSHFALGINEKSRVRCANPVDDGTSLWKGKEKAAENLIQARVLNSQFAIHRLTYAHSAHGTVHSVLASEHLFVPSAEADSWSLVMSSNTNSDTLLAFSAS
jgi:hypothetical protein